MGEISMNGKRLDMAARAFADRFPRRAALLRLAGAAAGVLASVGPAKLALRRAMAQEATPPAGASAFIVIRRYQLKAGNSMDALVELVNDGFVPIIRKIAGFKEYLLVDAGEGEHLSVSLFDDQSGAEASTRDAAEWAAANVAQLIEGPPEVTEGWVRIHVTAAGATETV
jgi:hypothetical protein